MTIKANNKVIDTILKRSWDKGLSFIKEGSFKNREELENLYEIYYPWDTGAEEEEKLIQELLDKGYLEPNGDSVKRLQIEGHCLYVKYTKLNLCLLWARLIYDKGQSNYLLGFRAFNSAAITGAIDLATGTVGYYNSGNNIYRAVGRLCNNDLDDLNNLMNDNWTVDHVCTVTRENVSAMA